MTYKFIITNNRTNECVFVTYAPNDAAALDEYAAYRSGYDTLAEMVRSAVFRDLADVSARYTA